MEAERERNLEEMRRIVLIREQDLAEAFNSWNRLLASLESEASESKRWEILGRAKTVESVFFSTIAKLLSSYRSYAAALENEVRKRRS